MSGDLSTAYTGIKAALVSTVLTTPSWGLQAYADFAPRNTSGAVSVVPPYVVFGFSGGGDGSNILRADPELLIDVISVTDTLGAALIAEEEIRARLDDAGEHEQRRVAGDTFWVIRTVTREMRIHFVEQVSGATQKYHSGSRYRLEMEKRS